MRVGLKNISPHTEKIRWGEGDINYDNPRTSILAAPAAGEQKITTRVEDGTNKSSKLNLGTSDVRGYAPRTQNKIIVTVLSFADGLQCYSGKQTSRIPYPSLRFL